MEDGHRSDRAIAVELDRLRRRVAEVEALLIEAATDQRPRAEAVLHLKPQSLLDLSGVMFVAIDGDQRVTLVNRMACRVLGCTEEEALGCNWFDTFIPPEPREEVRAVFRSILEGELQPVEYFENQVLTRGGDRRIVTWHNAILKDRAGRVVGTLSSGLDVTERRRAEEALKESEERFRTLFESAHDGLLVADAETRRFVTGNRAICTMLGCSPEEITGLGVEDIHPSEEMPRVLAAFEDLGLERLAVARDLPVRRRVGSVFYADISSASVTLGGRACQLGVFRDVTERRQAEEERLRLEAKALEAQKLESLGVLASGIAHDFNNILVGILGHADLALAELPPTSPAVGRVAEVVTAARRAAELCRQLLAYAGRGRLVVEPVDLSDLVREMVHLLEVGVGKRASLRTELKHDLPPVHGDATQLRQLVMNLITNAAEAVGPDGGVVRVRTDLVHRCRADLAASPVDDGLSAGEYLTLEVADTGCGMDTETRRRLFEPFFTTKLTGRGLGLAAVLGIVRGHHGAIRLESEPGRGSVFTVLLPAASWPLTTPAELSPDPGWRGMGIALLAEDDDSVRAVARLMLERLGFDVLTAADGQEAVEVFRDRAEAVACVVLDLTMPRLDGEGALRGIRAIRPDVPVLIASGYCLPETLIRTAGGCIDFVQKPYRAAELEQKLRRLLGGRG